MNKIKTTNNTVARWINKNKKASLIIAIFLLIFIIITSEDFRSLFFLLVLPICIYFIPGFVAQNNHHKDENSIWILNIFLGWTFIGWVIALIWAVKK